MFPLGYKSYTSDTEVGYNRRFRRVNINNSFFLHLYWLENRRKSICRVKGFLSYLGKKKSINSFETQCEIDKIRTENDNDDVIGLGVSYGVHYSKVRYICIYVYGVVKYSSGKAFERK